MREKRFSIGTKEFKGYTSRTDNVSEKYLAPPSINFVIGDDLVARRRKGYTRNNNDLGRTTNGTIHKQDNINWIFNGNVYYVDGDLDTKTAVDTGIAVSNPKSGVDFYAGDMYFTNTTDGLQHVFVFRLNGSVASGAGTITVDLDGAARLSVFGNTTGTIRVGAQSYPYTAVNVSNGQITLTGTTTQAYDDNTLCVVHVNRSSGREKASIIKFWNNRMILAGSVVATNSDDPTRTLYFSKYALPYSAGSQTLLENIIDFTYGTDGSVRELVGGKGAITNIVDTNDYLYVFKSHESYYLPKSEINLFTGQSSPKSTGQDYGCLNQYCAVNVGNGRVIVLTSDKKIVEFNIATDSGAPVSIIKNNFDKDVREILQMMDDEQPDAFMHFDGKRVFIQVLIDSQAVTLVYDTYLDCFYAPFLGWYFTNMMTTNGKTYATDIVSDNIYKVFDGFSDDGDFIESVFSTGVFNIGDFQLDDLYLTGDIAQDSQVYVKPIIDGADSDTKVINGDAYSFGTGSTLGGVMLGDTAFGGLESTNDTAEYEKLFDIYPCEGAKTSLKISSFGDNGYFSVKSYQISGRSIPDSSPLS